ncbi:hypothetical protein HKD37_18G051055 [Glycine soja]
MAKTSHGVLRQCMAHGGGSQRQALLGEGPMIPFDKDAINQFLGYPLVLEEGQRCKFSQRRSPASGFDEEAIRITPPRHPVDPEKSNRALGFPALIMGLCQFYGVPGLHRKILHAKPGRAARSSTTATRGGAAVASRRCAATTSTAATIPGVHLRSPAKGGAPDARTANHRGLVQLNESFYRYTLHQQSQDPSPFPWPTPEQIGATIAWLGDRPSIQIGVMMT